MGFEPLEDSPGIPYNQGEQPVEAPVSDAFWADRQRQIRAEIDRESAARMAAGADAARAQAVKDVQDRMAQLNQPVRPQNQSYPAPPSAPMPLEGATIEPMPGYFAGMPQRYINEMKAATAGSPGGAALRQINPLKNVGTGVLLRTVIPPLSRGLNAPVYGSVGGTDTAGNTFGASGADWGDFIPTVAGLATAGIGGESIPANLKPMPRIIPRMPDVTLPSPTAVKEAIQRAYYVGPHPEFSPSAQDAAAARFQAWQAAKSRMNMPTIQVGYNLALDQPAAPSYFSRFPGWARIRPEPVIPVAAPAPPPPPAPPSIFRSSYFPAGGPRVAVGSQGVPMPQAPESYFLPPEAAARLYGGRPGISSTVWGRIPTPDEQRAAMRVRGF